MAQRSLKAKDVGSSPTSRAEPSLISLSLAAESNTLNVVGVVRIHEGEPFLVLELDHINGVNNHSQTDTFCGKNVKKKVVCEAV